ncbi:MAG: DNA gyrase subunit A [Gammaproteobacteria bacterium]|nr:DNA gyrase subunit A [Gammaproteobacteria bacterium]
MTDFAKEVLPVNLEDEMKQSYLDYAMSVIVGRALPDVRDGLKPVHRRVLYAMSELGNDWNKAYKKSARVVGDVIGKYHPHGDTAVYDTMVRMAQPFSMRYMLIDGQGNFGSIDGDAPAAMRYTEVRMAKIAHELMADLDKETVDFTPNYDETEFEPAVFPSRVPNLLVNGSTGIAVGMATNIPPHNLGEVINAVLALLDVPNIDIEGLMEYLPGPDFPTGAVINGTAGIREAYRTGRGRIYVQAKAHFEETDGRDVIVVTELPYQVNKARLLEKIAELVREKKLEGITELRDESDKDGMRMVIVLRRGEVPDVILNNLYKMTQMQSVFGINMVALSDRQPKVLNLKDVLEAFLRHRREVVTRRSIFLLRKSRERAHLLEGLAIALANIDPVIKLIRESSSPAEAKAGLLAKAWEPGVVTSMLEKAGQHASRPEGLEDAFGLLSDGYHLSDAQAQAILDLRLHRLTGLEQDKIVSEFSEVLGRIKELLDILTDPDRLKAVIREELEEIREQYADERRTEINIDYANLSLEDLIADEGVIVTLSHAGYVKSQLLSEYNTQHRGGRGKSATAMKDEDFIEKLFIANTHDSVLFFSSAGKVYWKKIYELPQGTRSSKGRPIVNLLPLENGERINAVLTVRAFPEDQYVFMATRNGVVKKTALSAFSRPRSNGIIAIDLRDGDCLVDVALTDGDRDILLVSNEGKAIRFHESNVRKMGRVASGVRGIKLGEGQKVIALIVVDDGDLLTATENGYGKRTRISEYPTKGRGGQGVIDIQTKGRNGKVIGACLVNENDEIMLITKSGTLVRTSVEQISIVGRNTQGVRLIRLDEGEHLVEMEPVLLLNGENDIEQPESEPPATD